MSEPKFKMGDRVKELPGGPTGAVLAITLYATGNVSYCLAHSLVDGTPAHRWVDETNLEHAPVITDADIEQQIERALGQDLSGHDTGYIDASLQGRAVTIDARVSFEGILAAAEIIRKLPKWQAK